MGVTPQENETHWRYFHMQSVCVCVQQEVSLFLIDQPNVIEHRKVAHMKPTSAQVPIHPPGFICWNCWVSNRATNFFHWGILNSPSPSVKEPRATPGIGTDFAWQQWPWSKLLSCAWHSEWWDFFVHIPWFYSNALPGFRLLKKKWTHKGENTNLSNLTWHADHHLSRNPSQNQHFEIQDHLHLGTPIRFERQHILGEYHWER